MCEIVGHLVKSEQLMGRSLVIDLNAPASQNFRQVDHRTIQSIVFKNVKYNLGKKSTLSTLEGWKYDDKVKWNVDKLKVGDWFSENQFYKLTDHKDKVTWDFKGCDESAEPYQIPVYQVHEMYSGTLFEKEEKVTRTELVDLLLNAKETVFTVTFRKKVTPEDV